MDLELCNVAYSPNCSSLMLWQTLVVLSGWHWEVPAVLYPGIFLIYWFSPLVTPSSPLPSNFWAILQCLAALAVSVHTYFHNCFPNPLVVLLFPPHFTSSVLVQAAAASLAQKRLNSKVHLQCWVRDVSSVQTTCDLRLKISLKGR